MLVTGCATTSLEAPRADAQAPARREAAPVLPSTAAVPQPDTQAVVRAPADSAPLAAPRTDMPAAVVHADLWARMRTDFSMPEMNTPLVAQQERFYLQRRDYLQRMFERGGKYLFYIMEELDRRGMPAELALLPFVESAMNPKALSPAQAAGLWQFIPSTGKQYDLQQNWWVDNRRDVVKSTHAALDYLQRIYVMQGNDWFLALASYNWGEGSVQRAMKKNARAGLPTDYLSLSMPDETRHYVPKLIALRNIVRNAQELGLKLPHVPNKPYFVTVEKTRPIDLKLAAKFAGMSTDEFVSLNPAHNRPVIAASKHNQIRLPIDRVDAFVDAIERHGQQARPFASWQPHTLKAGETLDQVASRGGVAPAEVRAANGLQASQKLLPGTRIIAPQPEVKDETAVETFVAPRVYEAIEKPAAYHTVSGKKETVDTVAQRYGIAAATLRAWNNVKAKLRQGMTLLVRPAAIQTLLTTESGEKQVVATTQKLPEPVAMPVMAEDDAATRRDEKAKQARDDDAPRARTAHLKTTDHKAARTDADARAGKADNDARPAKSAVRAGGVHGTATPTRMVAAARTAPAKVETAAQAKGTTAARAIPVKAKAAEARKEKAQPVKDAAPRKAQKEQRAEVVKRKA